MTSMRRCVAATGIDFQGRRTMILLLLPAARTEIMTLLSNIHIPRKIIHGPAMLPRRLGWLGYGHPAQLGSRRWLRFKLRRLALVGAEHLGLIACAGAVVELILRSAAFGWILLARYLTLIIKWYNSGLIRVLNTLVLEGVLEVRPHPYGREAARHLALVDTFNYAFV